MNIPKSFGQTKLPIPEDRSRDRNFKHGGRSFYFFDFDDNIVHLETKIIVFSKKNNEEREVSTSDWPQVYKQLGQPGIWEDFEVRDGPGIGGSYRNFRELPKEHLQGRHQPLIEDMLMALENPYKDWRGPSWNFFVHAVNNNRPISMITARGHHPHTIRRVVDVLVLSGDLDAHPNYLSIYPVSHPDVRRALGDLDWKLNTAELKKRAIKAAVEDAFACYGENPFHRFGMSDDDPHNIALIIDAMRELKVQYPENAFYAFNTHGGQIVREEVLAEGTHSQIMEIHGSNSQMSLFNSEFAGE